MSHVSRVHCATFQRHISNLLSLAWAILVSANGISGCMWLLMFNSNIQQHFVPLFSSSIQTHVLKCIQYSCV